MIRGLPALLVLTAALALPPAVAAQDLEVQIRGSSGRAYQVAVQRFEPDAQAGSFVGRFHQELLHGLRDAASFAVVPPAAFLEPETTVDFSAPMIPCDNWRGIGADILVQGRIRAADGDPRIYYRVWDIGRCRMQGEVGYLDSSPEDLWLTARRLADEIVFRFSGRRGVSSTQIAFVSDVAGNKEIYLMEADGTRRRRVTSNGRINLFPSWSPDGRTLIYTSYRAGSADLWMLARGRAGKRLLEIPAEKYRGVWGPQDGQVTFVMSRGGNTDLYITRDDGRGLKRITNGRSIEVSPSWSPDGRKLVFASDRAGSQQIYLKDMDSGKVRRLTYKGSYNASPAWSPTGEWIVYTARIGSTFDLYLIDPETGYTSQLTDHPRSEENPGWSPDGRKVVFSSDRRGRKDIYTVDADGRNSRRITEGFGNCSNPAWSRWQD